MEKPIVAILYDFDKTLCTRDMQEYTFIPSVGMEPHEFWAESDKLAKTEQMDTILSYMYCMLHFSNLCGKPIHRESLYACGEHVEYHPGVEGWFERINAYGDKVGVQVEHYVLSSGLKEIIEGTSIARYFTKIFACEFMYVDGVAAWPKMAVNYTGKTQFVYRINKGVLDISNNADVNNSKPEEERRVFFPNMIYIGDGLTDVPCMKLVKQSGGHSIALYQHSSLEVATPLLKHSRVDWMFEADYTEGSELDVAMHLILDKLANDNRLRSLNRTQKESLGE